MFLARISRRVAEFASNRRGNVAVIFALALMPVTLLAGGSVDLSTAMNARSRLAQALDAAALAVGTNATISDEEALEIATGFINANYPERELGNITSVTVSLDTETDTVTVRGAAEVRTTMLGLAGIQTITVHWESVAQRARQRIELAMVLDNTGSMGGSKIRGLRDAAHLLSEILFEGGDDPDDVMIGLVPFAATVNVGTGFERDWWLDPDATSPIHAEWAGGDYSVEECRGRGRRRTCTTTTIHPNHWDLFDQLQNTSWGGCVESRSLPMDIDDTPPNAGQPETLFVPHFAPDEPDTSYYPNDYIDDDVSGSAWDRLRNLPKYDGARPNRGGPNAACTSTPITALTNSRSRVDRAISDMDANGTTNIANGVSWGVRVLSPQMPFSEGTGYDDRDVLKAMVILTDGDNVLRGENSDFMSEYEAYGYIADNRLGIRTTSDSRLSEALDERTIAACNYAKAQGIRVYTITFQVNSSSTRRMMEACASSPSLYFDSPSTSALRDTFEMIAGDLANLRLAR
ncbi:pilus assembly protein [Maricaulis salignorans]|uniref:Flp pilus assembly protein TadG n=1 Tax=Maricaulis salignorans TaxID=144026 RepID=A0A1G9W7L7_9PROT|nr:pilus assembly protein [Maricaulis salignorans]SDM80544.1 Flp pilus assembly protein TadG [Maricaulis salignorans]